MIKDNMTPYNFKVTFEDSGVKLTHFTDDKKYFENLVSMHGHLDNLKSLKVVLDSAQQARLDTISKEGLSGSEASLYVQYGTVEDEESSFYDAVNYEQVLKDQVAPKVKAQRTDAEESPVFINNVPYDGDASNRQAMQEALMAADDAGETDFDSWKDSSGVYHKNHPVEDVRNALRKVGQRRSTLIAMEADYVEQVALNDKDIFDLDWTTSFDT